MPNHTKLTFLKSWLADNNLPVCYKAMYLGNNLLYINTGQQYTNTAQVQIVQDVPDYLTIIFRENSGVKLKIVQTLKGHVVELDAFKTLNDYLLQNFNAKNRNNLKRYVKKLETCFSITYKVFFGTMDRHEYDALFVTLEALLIRRFQQKQEANYELQHLEEFHKTIYQLVLDKKANIFVIYDADTPISIRVNLFNNSLGYYIISAYDIDYSKFHLGAIDMLKNIEWCIIKNYKLYDLLKGYNNYKSKWATQIHYYNMHILYNPKQLSAICTANYQAFKEKCRYKLYHFYLNNKISAHHKRLKKQLFRFSYHENPDNNFIINIENTTLAAEKLKPIDIRNNKTYHFLKDSVYNFLYETNTSINMVKVFVTVDSPNCFVIQGINKSKKITIISKTKANLGSK